MNNFENTLWPDYTVIIEKLAVPEDQIKYYVPWGKRYSQFESEIGFRSIPIAVKLFLY
jgi:hypothetical protein